MFHLFKKYHAPASGFFFGVEVVFKDKGGKPVRAFLNSKGLFGFLVNVTEIENLKKSYWIRTSRITEIFRATA